MGWLGTGYVFVQLWELLPNRFTDFQTAVSIYILTKNVWVPGFFDIGTLLILAIMKCVVYLRAILIFILWRSYSSLLGNLTFF